MDFKKYQPRGKDGKYKTYKFIIKIMKGFVELCKKKNHYKLKY